MAKNIVITGATSGIGKAAALKLAHQGHRIITLSRNPAKSQGLLDDFEELNSSGGGKIEIVKGDLALMESLEEAIEKIKGLSPSPDILINNAGVWNFSFRETSDHLEETLQINVLSHALLTHSLLPEIVKNQGRIIFTSSGLHQGKINFEDIEYRSNFSGFSAYRQSKLGAIMMARYLSEKYGALGLKTFSQHPGVVNTQLGRDAPWLANLFFKIFGKSPEKGAQNLVYLSSEVKAKLENGAYYQNQKPKKASKYSRNLSEAQRLVEYLEALSPAALLNSRRLFELS